MKQAMTWVMMACWGIGLTLIAAPGAMAAVTNTAPWQESFESYTNDAMVNGTNGWWADLQDAAVVTTNAGVVDALTNYPAAERSYPIPSATHTRVLKVSRQVRNETTSATNGVVTVDFMAMPVPFSTAQPGDPLRQLAFYVLTNGHLVVWHRNTTAGEPGVNEWRELSGATVNTGVWSRFTIQQDYARKRFQLSVNQGAPVNDPAAWTTDGTASNGSWFCMVQTNNVMTRFRFGEDATNYVDDVVVARRFLTWSGAGFVESVTNNGVIDDGAPVILSLAHDTFNAAPGADLVAGGKVVVSGLASNLAARALVSNSTQAVVTVMGAAQVHEATNSFSFSLAFTDEAFTLGGVWDVSNASASVSVTFSNTPSLAYSGLSFTEAAANDGSIDNTTPLLVTLTNGQFTGSNGDNLALNTNAVSFPGLPAGLTGEVVRLSPSQVRVRWLGKAVQNSLANNTTATLLFGDSAFITVPASSVFHSVTNIAFAFTDPSVLSYSSTTISESLVNDGSLNSITLTLANKAFNATNGEDLVAAGKVNVSHLPAGLGVQMIRGVTDQEATLVFTGTATSNLLSASITNLAVTFTDDAFVGGNAAGVVNFSLPDLQVQFMDPRVVTISGLTFTEISGGAIDNRNPVRITLAGESFTGSNGDDFFTSGKITQSGLPPGLVLQATRDSATQLSLRLTGLALNHASPDSVSNVVFTLQNSAFVAGSAAYVENYQMSGISVAFTNDTGFFNVMPYAEPFEGYLNGFWMAGTNGWSAAEPGAGVVTNLTTVNALLNAYQAGHYYGLPIQTNHTKTLYVQNAIQVEVSSESAPLACLDFMTIPVPMGLPVYNDTNRQFAFYVNTNQNLVIWHRNTTGGEPGVNEWLTLTNLVSTSQWVRFTVMQDYANHLFQIRMNESAPVVSPYGWTDAGLVRTGSWFHMVQTNASMTRFKVVGLGEGYVDDLTVRTSLPGFARPGGTIFLFR